MKNQQCINNQKEQPWILEGKAVCMATHPAQPNWSGHSRGRKIHLAKDDKFTVCNMLIDGYIPDSNHNWSPVSNGKCGNCFKKK